MPGNSSLKHLERKLYYLEAALFHEGKAIGEKAEEYIE